MNTKDKLFKIGISTDDKCVTCAREPETIDHLFFDCCYSREVVKLVGDWLGMPLPIRDILDWRLNMRGSKVRIDMINAAVNACIYHTWRQRNTSRFEMHLLRPQKVADNIIGDVKLKLKGSMGKDDFCEQAFLNRLIGRQ
ncbi:uncharacterized protein LOC141630978 [Silene latifolia]|uniref:uncharacterized protein LOC141630978 n=1 Tax=Silene latifolia TaxID=37657 RepID=UPI003D76CF99